MSHDTSHDTSHRRRSRDGLWPLVFLAPLMIGVIVFYFWPILATFLNSFSSFGPFGDRSFAGLENLIALLAALRFVRPTSSDGLASPVRL